MVCMVWHWYLTLVFDIYCVGVERKRKVLTCIFVVIIYCVGVTWR